MERTARKIDIAGKMTMCGAISMKFTDVFSNCPQVGTSGGKPRPRKDSVDSLMIAEPTASVAAPTTEQQCADPLVLVVDKTSGKSSCIANAAVEAMKSTQNIVQDAVNAVANTPPAALTCSQVYNTTTHNYASVCF